MSDINGAMSVACVNGGVEHFRGWITLQDQFFKREFASTPRSFSFVGAMYEADVSNLIARNRQSDV